MWHRRPPRHCAHGAFRQARQYTVSRSRPSRSSQPTPYRSTCHCPSLPSAKRTRPRTTQADSGRVAWMSRGSACRARRKNRRISASPTLNMVQGGSSAAFSHRLTPCCTTRASAIGGRSVGHSRGRNSLPAVQPGAAATVAIHRLSTPFPPFRVRSDVGRRSSAGTAKTPFDPLRRCGTTHMPGGFSTAGHVNVLRRGTIHEARLRCTRGDVVTE